MKAGYPPYQLTLIPELPLSSLGLANGDQIIVTQKAGSTVFTQPEPTVQPSTRGTTSPTSPKDNTKSGEPDYVVTDSGVLVHRVCMP